MSTAIDMSGMFAWPDEAAAEAAEIPAELMDSPPPAADTAALDAWIDGRLAAIGAAQRQMRHNADVADRRKLMITNWLDEANGPLARRAEFLTQQLEVIARSYPYAGKSKSRSLPCGTIGVRANPDRLEIEDADAALAFAKATPELAPDVKVRESIGVTPLKQWAQSTGQVPEGCAFIAGGENRPYVKIKEAE